jgi:hypothetical protein
MQRNLDNFGRVVRALLGLFFIFAAWQLYHHPASRLLAAVFGAYALWEAVSAKCPLHAKLGVLTPSDRMSPEKLFMIGVVGVQAVIAYEWWSAGWEKVSGGEFVKGIAGTLGFFASKNPFPWYKAFLEGFAAKNASVFAYAVEWSQIAIAVVLAAAVIVHAYGKKERVKRGAIVLALAALFGGMLMNANFYLAAGWTSPGTKGSNVVMFWTQAVLCYVWLSTFMTRKPAATP